MKPRSINAQLLLVILGVTVLCWIAVVAVVVTYLSLNRTSTWDEKLAAIATQLLVTIPANSRFERKAGPGLELPAPVRRDHDPLIFQIWLERGRLAAGTPGSPRLPLQPNFIDGAASTFVEGRKWRVYSVSDRSGRVTVQVGNLQSIVDADLRHEASHALMLATLLLLLAGIIMWFVVRSSLKPVMALGAAMLKRRSFDLTPLPLERLPSELHPLVTPFNHVLRQLNEAIEGERRFIGDAAHELRAPLSALQAQVEIALRADHPETTQAALQKLLVMAKRSTRLSEQLLDLARLNAGAKSLKQVEADLSGLVRHVVREFEVCAAQNQRAIYLNVHACQIRCDIDEIGILLRNLIDNALRYTAADGRVLVSCGYRSVMCRAHRQNLTLKWPTTDRAFPSRNAQPSLCGSTVSRATRCAAAASVFRWLPASPSCIRPSLKRMPASMAPASKCVWCFRRWRKCDRLNELRE